MPNIRESRLKIKSTTGKIQSSYFDCWISIINSDHQSLRIDWMSKSENERCCFTVVLIESVKTSLLHYWCWKLTPLCLSGSSDIERTQKILFVYCLLDILFNESASNVIVYISFINGHMKDCSHHELLFLNCEFNFDLCVDSRKPVQK